MLCKCGSVLSAVTWTCVRGSHCPAAAKLPTLRHGEKQGDILSKSGPEPFALAGEAGPDHGADLTRQEQSARDRAASEKNQTQLF